MKQIYLDFKRVIDEIYRDKISFLFLFFQFTVLSGCVRYFQNDAFIVINFIITSLFCISNNKISDRMHGFIFKVIIIFLLLNIVPAIAWDFSSNLFTGYLLRILTGVFIIIYFQEKFLVYFEKLVYVLAFISIPLFLIQIVNPKLLLIFTPISNFLVTDNRSIYQSYGANFQYFFVYHFNIWAINRNSGFMWEPAAFGAMLAWAIAFNLFRNRFSLSTNLLIMFIAAVTTFSIGTILYLLLLLIFQIYYSKSLRSKVKLITTISIAFVLLLNTTIASKNINMLLWKLRSEQTNRVRVMAGDAKITDVSRVTGFQTNFNFILKWPFGYGYFKKTEVGEYKYLGRSPNGLMRMIVTWGIIGLLLIVKGILNLILKLRIWNNANIGFLGIVLMLIILILPLSGNPFYNQPLIFSLLIFGYLPSNVPIRKSNILNYH